MIPFLDSSYKVYQRCFPTLPLKAKHPRRRPVASEESKGSSADDDLKTGRFRKQAKLNIGKQLMEFLKPDFPRIIVDSNDQVLFLDAIQKEGVVLDSVTRWGNSR